MVIHYHVKTENIVHLFVLEFKWKRMWCRFVDTHSKNTRQQLLDVEMNIFKNVKKEVVDETGPWIGSLKQNMMADVKIAFSIFSSFKNYSGGMQRHGAFFRFKRT